MYLSIMLNAKLLICEMLPHLSWVFRDMSVVYSDVLTNTYLARLT